MKLWIDDVRPAPDGYVWAHSVYRAEKEILKARNGIQDAFGYVEYPTQIEIIDIDHDAGEYACYGGDYIRLLDWLEEKGYNYPIHIHSMNPVGVQNMRAIIKRNNWKEV